VTKAEVKQLMIKGKLIGIAGLDDAIGRAASILQGRTDQEIKNSLLAVVAVNNKVVSVGDMPPKSKIRQWIIEACNQTPETNK